MAIQSQDKKLDPESRCINCNQFLAIHKCGAYYCTAEGCNKYGLLTMGHRLAHGSTIPVEHKPLEVKQQAVSR